MYFELCHADRNTLVVTLGGGVIGDIGGFAASTYARGIRWVNIPTSLLAMVDSSIGGKTGYNTKAAKNNIGTFWDPDLVIIELAFLDSLPAREFRSGLAEIVKYGLIGDPELFELLKDPQNNLLDIVERSVSFKMSVVEKDHCEKNERRILNFGHTLGHALESFFNYSILTHGEAIALGIRFALWLSQKRLNLPPSISLMVDRFFYDFVLLKNAYPGADEITDFIKLDKKHIRADIACVLLKDLGDPFLMKISILDLLDAYSAFRIADSMALENSTLAPTAIP